MELVLLYGPPTAEKLTVAMTLKPHEKRTA